MAVRKPFLVSTLMLTEADFPSDVAVIVAVPGALALTAQVDDTRAKVLLAEGGKVAGEKLKIEGANARRRQQRNARDEALDDIAA